MTTTSAHRACCIAVIIFAPRASVRAVTQLSARKWSIACPFDQEETPMKKNDAATLGKCFAVVAEIARLVATGALPFRVHIRNMVSDSWPLVVAADDTLDDLKLRIHEVRAECVVNLQRFMNQREDDEFVVLDDEYDDDETLCSLGICDERVVTVVMRDAYINKNQAVTVRRRRRRR